MSCVKSTKEKSPRLCYRAPTELRYVAPFSIASNFQPNVQVYPLCNFPGDLLGGESNKKLNVLRPNTVNSSLFRTLLLRGDIPCQRSFNHKEAAAGKKGTLLLWKVPPQDLDYSYYLPVFFDGLCEPNFPYNLIASYAIHDLLNADGPKVLPVIPQIILPIKNALNTKNRGVIAATLRIVQHLCMCAPCVGEALVPYFRQFLPVLNLFRNRNVNKLDRIDYTRVGQLGDVIDETLMTLERCGGSNAYINIKYSIPTYESCVNNCESLGKMH